MKIPFGSLALVSVASVIAREATAQSRLAKPIIDTVNHHIVRVMNNGPTAWTDTNGWKLVYERTVQPKDGTPGELVRPESAILLDDGRLIITDKKPERIELFDAKGAHIRTIGRVGSGPGEYRQPFIGIFHDTLVVDDPGQARAFLMTLDGKFLRQFPSNCCSYAPISVDSRGNTRVYGSRVSAGNVEGQWVFIDWSGRRADSMPLPKSSAPPGWTLRTTGPNGSFGSSTYGIPLGGYTVPAALRNGNTVFGGTNRYELFITRRGTDTIRMFGRTDLAAHPAPKALRDSLFHALVDKNDRARSVAVYADIPSVFPPWDNVTEDGAGNLWVMRGKSYEKAPRLDVFTPEGVLRGDVAVPFKKGEIMAWSRDHLAVYDEDENDLPRIRIFRIDRRGH